MVMSTRPPDALRQSLAIWASSLYQTDDFGASVAALLPILALVASVTGVFGANAVALGFLLAYYRAPRTFTSLIPLTMSGFALPSDTKMMGKPLLTAESGPCLNSVESIPSQWA